MLIDINKINEPTPVKYKGIISEVRDNVTNGVNHAAAVESSLAKNWFKFESIEDQERLRSWLLGSFDKFAA